MSKQYISFDNGVTARGFSVFYPDGGYKAFKLPTKSCENYQKTVKKNVTRIDAPKLVELLSTHMLKGAETLAVMERPMVNAMRFNASLSAVRCLEATLVVLESLNIPYRFLDSKEWQSVLLPQIKGSDGLKEASLALGKKLFPDLKLSKDADYLLIGEYARRKQL